MFHRIVIVGALAALILGVAGLERPASAQWPEVYIHIWWVDPRGDEQFEWGVITPSGEERIWFRAFTPSGEPFEDLDIEFHPQHWVENFGCDNDPYRGHLGSWFPPPTDADGYTYLDLKGSGCGEWAAGGINAIGYATIDLRSPDLDVDGDVDLDDFSTFTQLYNGTDPCADYNNNGKVDLSDFLLFEWHFLDNCGEAMFGPRPELPLTITSPEGPDRGGNDAATLPGPVVGSSETVVEASLHPNPFRSGTEVRFVLQAPAPTVVDIFDVAGRKLQTLHEGRLGAARHTFRWDGRDSAGRRAAAGVYYARIQAGADVLTIKGALIH